MSEDETCIYSARSRLCDKGCSERWGVFDLEVRAADTLKVPLMVLCSSACVMAGICVFSLHLCFMLIIEIKDSIFPLIPSHLLEYLLQSNKNETKSMSFVNFWEQSFLVSKHGACDPFEVRALSPYQQPNAEE